MARTSAWHDRITYMKTTQKGGMLLWLIVLIIILGGAVYIKTLKQKIADLEKTQSTTATSTATTR